MADLEDSPHRPVAQTLTIRALKSSNRFRCNGRFGVEDSGNTTIVTFIALLSLRCMSIQDDIDALAAMAMTCFSNHRSGMDEKTLLYLIYLNQLDLNTTKLYFRAYVAA